MHSGPRYWRGYVAALVWDRAAKKWLPTVLEVSESLELDMRGIYSPGQVWEISRGQKQKDKKPPYVGRLVDQSLSLAIFAPFDVRPIVEGLYHCRGMQLDQPSDREGRTYLPAIEAPAPRGETGYQNGAHDDPAKMQAMRDKLAQQLKGK